MSQTHAGQTWEARCLFNHPPVRVSYEDAKRHWGKEIADELRDGKRKETPSLPRSACPHSPN